MLGISAATAAAAVSAATAAVALVLVPCIVAHGLQ